MVDIYSMTDGEIQDLNRQLKARELLTSLQEIIIRSGGSSKSIESLAEMTVGSLFEMAANNFVIMFESKLTNP